jgi:hypothetical protein
MNSAPIAQADIARAVRLNGGAMNDIACRLLNSRRYVRPAGRRHQVVAPLIPSLVTGSRWRAGLTIYKTECCPDSQLQASFMRLGETSMLNPDHVALLVVIRI